MPYTRAPFVPLVATGYGLALHWTTWTLPASGPALPFPEAVARFDVEYFVAQAQAAGVGHVLLTLTHELHWLPGPNPEVDRLLPGRTCTRDLPKELAEALWLAGISFGLYYNHGVHHAGASPAYRQDPAWQEAVGSEAPERARYYDNYCRVLACLGEHYGNKVQFLWLDSGYEHAKFPDTPWARLTAAAKAGYPDRLVCYNAGIANHLLYTPCQDFWAGELCDLSYRPPTPLTPAGLPWYSLATWHRRHYAQGGEWGIHERSRQFDWPPPPVAEAAAFARAFQAVGGVVSFNVLVYQDGTIYPSDLATLAALREHLRPVHDLDDDDDDEPRSLLP